MSRKIEIEIPDWAKGRNIYIFAGLNTLYRIYRIVKNRKLVGYRHEKVIVPCQRCGACCNDCEYLEKKGSLTKCGFHLPGKAGPDMPFYCAKGDGTNLPKCGMKIKSKEVKV